MFYFVSKTIHRLRMRNVRTGTYETNSGFMRIYIRKMHQINYGDIVIATVAKIQMGKLGYRG